MAKKSFPRKIKASLELQERVGTGQIDASKISAAQKVMDTNEVDFTQVAAPQLEKLQQAINAARKKQGPPEALMQDLKTPIMNLKANAGAFKYKFISDLTGMVLLLLEGIHTPDKKLVQIVDVLHKTILLALAYKMKGDGGANGMALVGAFEEICKKYRPRH